MTSKEVAKGYGISEITLRRHKMEQSEELVEGKHFIAAVRILNGEEQSTLKIPHNTTLWTKRGIIRLGFFIKSERSKLFRDWAEDLIIKVEEYGKTKAKYPQQITDTASPLQEKTLISVPLGDEMSQIWVEDGIVYAGLTRIMRYIGRGSVSPSVIEKVGRHHFIKVPVHKNQMYWFVSAEGFIEIAKYIEISKAHYHNILIMFGVKEPDPLPEWTYCFTETEILEIIGEINRKPVNKSNIIDMLLKGNRSKGGVQ